MIHRYTLFGYYIAIDVPSGSVHVLSEIAYKILGVITPPIAEKCPAQVRYELAKYDSSEVDRAYAELYELYTEGMLFTEDDTPPQPIPAKIPLKAMCLHIAHDCNMKCKYCFASGGDFAGERGLMSYEVGKKAIDFLLANSARKNLEIDFFGGEPLLNFDVVKALVQYGRERERELGKTIRFTLTTNGTLLNDEISNFINEEISNIVLSIDGRPEVNDACRTYNDGSSTYSDILPKYKKLVGERGDRDYYVRGTFTRANLDFASDVIHLFDQGFEQVSVEPVALPREHPLSIRNDDIPRIFKEYETLAKLIIKRNRQNLPGNFFHFMLDLENGPCIYKRTKGCGSGSEYIAVTPSGEIYPCHQFAGKPEFKMGNIVEGTFDRSVQSVFAGNNITSMHECSNCWAKFYCGGGCAANNRNFNGDIRKPHDIACELEKKRIECAIAIKAAVN